MFRRGDAKISKLQNERTRRNWINEELIKLFVTLHQFGKAKSFEVWQNGELMGGFYGVQVGNVFLWRKYVLQSFNVSKAGFIHFTAKYQNQWELIDCQIHSEHLESLGAKMIPKQDYLKLLKQQKP
jgi:leucyl/phenylalanyl-tRNA--protein transferase